MAKKTMNARELVSQLRATGTGADKVAAAEAFLDKNPRASTGQLLEAMTKPWPAQTLTKARGILDGSIQPDNGETPSVSGPTRVAQLQDELAAERKRSDAAVAEVERKLKAEFDRAADADSRAEDARQRADAAEHSVNLIIGTARSTFPGDFTDGADPVDVVIKIMSPGGAHEPAKPDAKPEPAGKNK